MRERITEKSNPRSLAIDEMSSLEIVMLMNDEDVKVLHGVKEALSDVARAIDTIVERWQRGGRCFVVGAGTSGRIGVIDAVELGPTFSVQEGHWMGLIAGGYEAMWRSLEENEDNPEQILIDLKAHSLQASDVVIGVSASGSTPYVLSALRYGKQIGAATISISCNPNTIGSEISDIGIEAVVGPEIIRGSTRLKAGTAQKMILNMLSTGTMIRLGKVYSNQMIEVQTINQKLVQRARESLMELADLSENEASRLLEESGHSLKKAIFMGVTKTSNEEAENYLQRAEGRVKGAISLYFGR